MAHIKSSPLRLSFMTVVLLVITGGLLFQQPLSDWIRLATYTPPPAIAQLATADTMTDRGQKLFYINRPKVFAKNQFSTYCRSTEQTIVLGCYHSPQRGIYVLKITDDVRLNGVMEVTAAHEMLHAAYDRLASGERTKINGWLDDYYRHDLTDQRIKDVMASYQKTEPDAIDNELHSILGTEVVQLPPRLEEYYSRYFTDRAAVARFAAGYQAEFTSRTNAIKGYDAQLQSLRQQIDEGKQSLEAQAAAIKSQEAAMEQLRARGQYEAYNAQVSTFNDAVERYNLQVRNVKGLIGQYNDLVVERNALALEQKQLNEELSGNNLSTIPD